MTLYLDHNGEKTATAGHWEGYAEYEDGTVKTITRQCRAKNYYGECEEEHAIECELIEGHEGCLHYEVSFVYED